MTAISAASLKGYLLEEMVAFLISKAGYRLLTDPEDDPHDLDYMSNGLQVRGRGGFHQADVLGELSWAPAFGNPIRLFIEAKWRGEGRQAISIAEVRHAVGILQDINQVLATVKPRRDRTNTGVSAEDIAVSGRTFCYSYRYALCSTSGFSEAAQTYALAHQVALLDLSHQDFHQMRTTINDVGDEIHADLQKRGYHDTRRPLIRRIRDTMRNMLWDQWFTDGEDARFVDLLDPLRETANSIDELFIGVSATGFVIVLKADDPSAMVRHMEAHNDPSTQIFYRLRDGRSSEWTIIVTSEGLPSCRLTFALPHAMLSALEEKRERGKQRAAINLKEQHFSRMTIYRVTDAKSLMCSLKIDRRWLEGAKRDLDRRRSV